MHRSPLSAAESSPPPGAAVEPTVSPWPTLSPAQAAGVAALWALALALISVFAHPTPFYTVETDLVGEYLPAASELARGIVNVAHYAFKGPGYPLLLAAFAAPLHGDVAVAARVLSPLAAGLAAWLAFALARAAAGGAVATFTLFAMLACPALVRYAIEAGTDAPALALMLASTWLLLRGGVAALLAAGLCAGYALITRGNAVFLLPCAALVLLSRPRRAQSLAAYALGAAVPLAAWYAAATRAGGLPADRNYLNVAWELYGQGVPWDQFETTAGTRFHSLLDVLRLQPAGAAAHIVRNLGLYRVSDLRELTMPWLGALAVPGVVLLARERRARAWLAHAAACALVLAPVFYNARFGLYLLPVYCAAAGAALAWLAEALRRFAATRGGAFRPLRAAGPALGAVLLALGAIAATIQTRAQLAGAPHEVRNAGRALARMGLAGERIVARKPHVAYFARMEYVPFPSEPPLSQLPAWALGHGARYLFFSGLEQVMRPGYAVLADSGLALPGFEQVLWGRAGENRFWAVYRLRNVAADSATFADAYHGALLRYEARRPDSGAALVFVAAQLIALGAPAEALERLDRLKRGGARDAAIERFRSEALLATGDLDGAASACEAAMRMSPPAAWDWSQLGGVRTRQRHYEEAHEAYIKATGIEPANLGYLESLGRTELALQRYAQAATTFERRLKLAPLDVEGRRYAIAAWQLAGNNTRARELFAEGVAAGIPAAAITGAR